MFVFLYKGMEWGKAGQYLKIGICVSESYA